MALGSQCLPLSKHYDYAFKL